MKKHLFLLLIVLFASCTHREVLPEGILDSATLTAFLTEAHIIEGYIYASSSEDPDTTAYYAQAAYDSLYSKYNITPEIYDSTLTYYIHHPKQMEEIYERVTANLKKIDQ